MVPSSAVVALRFENELVVEVKDAPPVMRGADSNQSRSKQALLVNGRSIKVPPFVSTGDRITVRLPEEDYVSRL